VIATLARRGHAIAARSLDRDFAVEHESGPAVEAAWVEIYRAWLQCRLARVVLPELWSARTAM
jgi:tryptophan 2,3-dioxygenase